MEDPIRRPLIGTVGVALNLMALCYFKYTSFVLDAVSALSGAHLTFGEIVLPLGISFFTFQQIAYLVDIMRGAKVERDIVSYTLFVCFFPHLIAGPLVHHAEMIPQFKGSRTARLGILAARGLSLFAAGLFKKVVIADNLAQFASPVFAHVDAGGSVASGWGWLATLAYTLQIYFDFSGYSDMAIGLALLFGIRLPVNFRSPYQATSIIEFWRRWHITLSRFLRDYLYIPLGGNRHGRWQRHMNLMITMLLGGLWHGAGWNFLIWGGLHGLYLSINHIWNECRKRETPFRLSVQVDGLSWSITLFSIVITWIFFRAKTLTGACVLLAGLFGFSGTENAFTSPGVLRVMDLPIMVGSVTLLLIGYTAVALVSAIALFAPNSIQLFGYREYRHSADKNPQVQWRPNLRWAIFTAMAFSSSLFGMWQRLEFLYFQF